MPMVIRLRQSQCTLLPEFAPRKNISFTCDFLAIAVRMKIETLIEAGKSVGITIISDVSKKMEVRESMQDLMEISCIAAEMQDMSKHDKDKQPHRKSADVTISSNVSHEIKVLEELKEEIMDSGLFSYSHCDYKSTEIKSLSIHNQVEHNQTLTKTVETNISQKMESPEESKHKELEFSCNHCGFRTNEIQDLENHNQSKHNVVTCNLCDYSTRRNPELIMHKKAKHEGFRYKCSICEVSFEKMMNLDRHSESVHDLKI